MIFTKAQRAFEYLQDFYAALKDFNRCKVIENYDNAAKQMQKIIADRKTIFEKTILDIFANNNENGIKYLELLKQPNLEGKDMAEFRNLHSIVIQRMENFQQSTDKDFNEKLYRRACSKK